MDPMTNQTNPYQYTQNPYRSYPSSAPRQLPIGRILLLAYILVIALGSWQVSVAIEAHEHTGTLTVSSSMANTQISITQDNHQALTIGTGSANVRLQPGVYQVAGFSDGTFKTAIVSVSAKHTSTTHLDLSSSSTAGSGQQLRTIEDVNFEGIDALISSGLSSEQASELEQYFFQFDQSAKTVSINTASVEPGPHNPNIISPFTLDFNVTIDASAYTATVAYYDTNNITLTLSNGQTGAQVFTAGSIQPTTAQ